MCDDTIKQIKSIRNKISRARAKVRKAPNLDEKIMAMKKVQQYERQLARIDNTYN